MKGLNNFKSNEISSDATKNVKGGVFCEWYINQRGGEAENAGLLMEKVDGVMIKNGNENFA